MPKSSKASTIKRPAVPTTHDITLVAPSHIKPHPHNARTHSKKQIRQIADSIQAVGFASPVLLDEHGMLLAGHGRLEAAKLLRLKAVPAIIIEGLSQARKRALLLADNRIAQSAGWDRERLAGELVELPELLLADGLDIAVTGFEPTEIDALLSDFADDNSDPIDDLDEALLSGPVVTQPGDLWQLGKHRLLCGDARDDAHVSRLMGRERAHMAFLDPPYNVRVRDIGGRGQVKHQEFVMASGEMSQSAFTQFLTDTLVQARNVSTDGSVAYVCMDWRHVGELVEAGRTAYGAMLNLVVWVKSNAGQGSFYRSQHELIGVFRVGNSPHLNTIELGRHGRSRSNVWKYAGVNSFRAGRMGRPARPSDRQTSRISGGCDQGLQPTRSARARYLQRLRYHAARGRARWAASSSSRYRSALRRRCNSTLAGLHGPRRHPHRQRSDLRRDRWWLSPPVAARARDGEDHAEQEENRQSR